MGRGRQKAKQTKVARELKYFSPNTDYDALAKELHGGSSPGGPVTDPRGRTGRFDVGEGDAIGADDASDDGVDDDLDGEDESDIGVAARGR